MASVAGKILKTAAFAAVVGAGLAATMFGGAMIVSSLAAGTLFSSFASLGLLKAGVVAFGAELAAHAGTVAGFAGIGAAVGGVARASEEFLTRRFERIKGRQEQLDWQQSQQPSQEKAPARGREQDYSGMYDSMNIQPRGSMAAQIEAQRARTATVPARNI